MDHPRLSGQNILKFALSIVAGGSFLILSAFILIGTIVSLTLATPLVVIFSPVLVPATITVFIITVGFVSSGGFGVAALAVVSWIYRYMMGKHLPGSEQVENGRMKLADKAYEMRVRAEQFRHQHTTG